jgi:hypothetical protein
MAGVLLVLFPVLLMFNTYLAWIALATGMVLLVNKRLSAARPVPRRAVKYDEYDSNV